MLFIIFNAFIQGINEILILFNREIIHIYLLFICLFTVSQFP